MTATKWPGRTTCLRLARLALACACLLLPGHAAAARVAVVLSDDSGPYQEVYQVIRAYLDDTAHEVVRIYAEKLTALSLNETRLAVAVGVRAAESVAAVPTRPSVLAVLVPRAWYLKSGRDRLAGGSRLPASAIYLDQPVERQAQLIRLAFPEVRRVGVLVGVEQSALVGELDVALADRQLNLVHQVVAAGDRLVAPLEHVLTGAQVLLAVPDPAIFNRNTAQSLFLTSYRYHVPVLGYSQSLTRAGALLSLHSSPAQIGRQTAEWINAGFQATTLSLPPPAYPAYFSISVNRQVARSLGFTLLPEAELEKRLGGGI